MSQSIDACLEVLKRERLLTREALESARESAAEEGSTFSFAERIVSQGHLTEWQGDQLAIGRTRFRIGEKYVLVDKIGDGGQGVVYRANDELLNRPVALKVISRQFDPDDPAVGRLRREGEALARLDHRNIVRVWGTGFERDHCWLAMEFVDGEPLNALLHRNGPLAPSEACNITLQIANALHHAHTHGVFHRDLTPGNVLIRSAPGGILEAKVADFGLALVRSTDPSAGTEPMGLTEPGTLLGTPGYIPPESFGNASSADERSDLFSLGCILFELVAGEGELPYLKDQWPPQPPPRDILTIRPDCPLVVQTLLRQLLPLPRAERVSEASVVCGQLEQYFRYAETGSARLGSVSQNEAQPHISETISSTGRVSAVRASYMTSSSGGMDSLLGRADDLVDTLESDVGARLHGPPVRAQLLVARALPYLLAYYVIVIVASLFASQSGQAKDLDALKWGLPLVLPVFAALLLNVHNKRSPTSGMNAAVVTGLWTSFLAVKVFCFVAILLRIVDSVLALQVSDSPAVVPKFLFLVRWYFPGIVGDDDVLASYYILGSLAVVLVVQFMALRFYLANSRKRFVLQAAAAVLRSTSRAENRFDGAAEREAELEYSEALVECLAQIHIAMEGLVPPACQEYLATWFSRPVCLPRGASASELHESLHAAFAASPESAWSNCIDHFRPTHVLCRNDVYEDVRVRLKLPPPRPEALSRVLEVIGQASLVSLAERIAAARGEPDSEDEQARLRNLLYSKLSKAIKGRRRKQVRLRVREVVKETTSLVGLVFSDPARSFHLLSDSRSEPFVNVRYAAAGSLLKDGKAGGEPEDTPEGFKSALVVPVAKDGFRLGVLLFTAPARGAFGKDHAHLALMLQGALADLVKIGAMRGWDPFREPLPTASFPDGVGG